MSKKKCVAINFTIPEYLLKFFELECEKKSFMAATSYNRNRMMVGVLEDYYNEHTSNDLMPLTKHVLED